MIEHDIHQFFIKNHLTLSLAESCTGGALAAHLVALPDCSLYFLGSIVAYSNEAKETFLSVSRKTLSKYGAVSEETAQEMAQGAILKFRSHFSLSTTGIAGPTGGSNEKPVGTVCFAISSHKSKILSWTSHFSGDRKTVISSAVEEGLSQLKKFIYIN